MPHEWSMNGFNKSKKHTQPLGNKGGKDGKKLERVRGIEPPYSAWEADVLPLNYTRDNVSDTSGNQSRGQAA